MISTPCSLALREADTGIRLKRLSWYSNDKPPAEPRASDNDFPYYDVLPEGLITLSDAARQYSVPSGRIHSWLRQDRPTRVGYLRGKSPQGGLVVLVEAELAALLEG